MAFWYNKEMHRRCGLNIMESQDIIVLIDLGAGDLPRRDFAENTVAHDKIINQKR
jgi:hypothetical protein